MAETPKKLKDLRVADLKLELEKRSLATSGIKAVLSERLKEALEADGHNVEEFVFEEANDAENKGEETKEGDEELVDEENNTSQGDDSAGQVVEEQVQENGLGGEEEEETVQQNGEDDAKEGVEGQEDDSLNLMIGDEDNLFEEESSEINKPNGLKRQPSPPRPETAPVKHPFTSKDTINLATRGGKAPSDNSSMLVNPDESQSVASHESGDGFKENDEKKDDDDDKGEKKVESTKEGEEGEGNKEEEEKAEEKKKVVSSSRNLWISGLSSTTRATDLKVKREILGSKVLVWCRLVQCSFKVLHLKQILKPEAQNPSIL